MAARLASRIGVVGAGKMAEAMVGGLVAADLQPPRDVWVYDVNPSRMDVLSSKFGVGRATDTASCVADSEVVLLAVKPQHIQAVLCEVGRSIPSTSLAVSIAAGCTVGTLSRSLPTRNVVRAMPNTPALVGQGMTVWTATAECSEPQLLQAESLLSCFGEELRVDDERYLDMATALVGSGPAFALLFMEAMIDTGVHMGFPRETAKRLVLKTLEGSSALARLSTDHVAALRNDITSPGGTTAAALYTSDRGGFRTTVADAIWAAYRRSLELGGKDSNVGPGRRRT